MQIFDAHCDTLSKIKENGFYENNFHFDLLRTKGYTSFIQVFAAFVDKNEIECSPFSCVMRLVELYHSELEKNSKYIKHCENMQDVHNAVCDEKVAAFLSIEGGEAIEGDIKKLHTFYKAGVRLMGLTWNYTNEIANSAVSADESPAFKQGFTAGDKRLDCMATECSPILMGGLTPFGREVVREMNKLGMIIDVSHISEKGFWDVLEITQKPIIASHSNVKSICNHPRNLNDRQIKALVKNKGCIGLNLYSDFLRFNSDASITNLRKEDEKGSSYGIERLDCCDTACIDDIMAHIDYFYELGAKDCLGIGSDFDGMENLPREISGVQDLHKIFEAMAKRGYSHDDIEKMASKNFLRIISDIL